MRKRCKKKKFSKLEAMLHISRAELRNKQTKGRTKRKECRCYYCDECKNYHLTSKAKPIKIEKEI